MKRRNAFLLGSAFLLVLAGYVAWCWRAFYLSPPVHYANAPSEEVIGLIKRWQKESPLGAPVSFHLQNAIHMLAKPSLRHYWVPMEARLARAESGEMMCEIWSFGSVGCGMDSNRYYRRDGYIKRNGKWMYETHLPSHESHVLPTLPSVP
jgi:hypothetical protein